MKTSYKVENIEIKEAISFLKQNKATLNQISLSTIADFYYGVFVDEVLVGVIGIMINKNVIRIKQFLVKEKYRKNGAGKALLKYILKDDKKYSVFATKFSHDLFSKNGFVVKTEKANDIKFMEREAKK